MSATPTSQAAALTELTETVLAHCQCLLHSYQIHDLHQLRVHIRRIRSLIKQLPEFEKSPLLDGWRRLFAETNPARDWDVLLETAHSLLDAPAAVTFEEAMRPATKIYRQQSLAMLRSGDWREQTEAWSEFLKHLQATSLCLPAGLLSEYRQRALDAQRRASDTGAREDWHRYRIAIKKLRYLATFRQLSTHGEPGIDELIERCKNLQDLLGAWHDCSVQLKILNSGEARNLIEKNGRARAICDDLIRKIRDRRQRLAIEIKASDPV